MALGTGRVTMAFPREGARTWEMGTWLPAGHPQVPSAIQSCPLSIGVQRAPRHPQHTHTHPPSRLGTAWGDEGTQAAWLGYLFPLPRQQLSPLALGSICHPR